ncbi:Anti-sigma-K factor RskA [Devosia sp. YR412]|uniref:anti-sigma factor n=1 Tax=Devosia sp. YR412 TaxID=1881030 RepID=UPI0008ABEF5B|nr:anti-sigma factor [Devosia sp. YR412]SEQ01422.1 Anti-sigma-K factor RskA [Devosia sp. YR412]
MMPEQTEQVGLYVLGTMEDADRADFGRAMRADPALQAAVDRLAAHLQHLDDTAAPAPVNSALWQTIESKLDGASASENVVAFPTHRRALPQWYGIAASAVIALGIGYLAGSMTTTAPREPLMIAVLLNEGDAQPGAIVEAFADDSIRLVPLEDFAVPEGRILQVWTLPDAGTGPVSLGTFSDPHTINLTGPELPEPASGQLYEITLEPAPGSPTGRPTGPILVKGFARPPV